MTNQDFAIPAQRQQFLWKTLMKRNKTYPCQSFPQMNYPSPSSCWDPTGEIFRLCWHMQLAMQFGSLAGTGVQRQLWYGKSCRMETWHGHLALTRCRLRVIRNTVHFSSLVNKGWIKPTWTYSRTGVWYGPLTTHDLFDACYSFYLLFHSSKWHFNLRDDYAGPTLSHIPFPSSTDIWHLGFMLQLIYYLQNTEI